MEKYKKFWINFEKNKDKFFHDFIRDEVEDLLSDKVKDTKINFFWDRETNIDFPYVVYNTEQLNLADKNISSYTNFLKNASEVYDYSEKNLENYPSNIFVPYLPNLNSKYNQQTKEIEVLFYGLMTPRRSEIIENLKKQYNIHHINYVCLGEMAELIKKSKWVLSISSYDNTHNDLMRITPALNLGANILLEETEEKWYNDYLKNNFSNRIKIL